MDLLGLVLFVAALASVISTVAVCLFGFIDFKQWKAISKIEDKIEAFEQQDIGESFGEWLLRTEKLEDGRETSNMQILCHQVGSEIAHSVSMAAKGIQSGDVREFRAVERKVLESIESPEVKALLSFCDQAGIPREAASIVASILEKRGFTPDRLFKNDGAGSSSTW